MIIINNNYNNSTVFKDFDDDGHRWWQWNTDPKKTTDILNLHK